MTHVHLGMKAPEGDSVENISMMSKLNSLQSGSA
jgi:hypothetical protein